MPDEETKKKAKKFVVEETEEPAPEIDSETTKDEDSKMVEDVVEPEKIEEPVEIEETETKKERPQRSILIPKNEEHPELTPDEMQEKDSKVSGFWVFALAIFIIASLIGGGALIFKAGVEKGKLESQSTPQAL